VINGIKTYVATPKVNYPKDKAVIYLTDVFGHELPNNLVLRYSPFSRSELINPIQLLSDDFANNGFKVYTPELFEGDPVAPDAFTTVCHPLHYYSR
jgi:dienelactone hydrolase